MQLYDNPDNPLGPFDTLTASITAMLAMQIKIVVSGEQSTYAVDTYLQLASEQSA